MTIKRLAVLLPFSPPGISGIANTLSDKVRYWASEVDDVRVFVLRPQGAASNPLLSGDNFFHVDGKSLQHAFSSAVPLIQQYQPEVLYARYSVPFLGYPALLDSVPTVFEIHSADLVEYRSQNRKLWLPAVLNRWRVLAGATGHVYANDSASDHWSNRVFKLPKRVIPNGISLDGIHPAESPVGLDRLRLVMTIGAPTVWQGADKFIDLAVQFPEHDFFLVTADNDEQSGDPANLKRVAQMPRSELLQFLASCHVGVGTLALYRSSREEVSSLKVREYLACGLALLMAHKDTDARINTLPQTLTIPNSPETVTEAKGEIAEFLESLRRGKVDRGSVEFISTSGKEAERLAFLSTCAAGRQE